MDPRFHISLFALAALSMAGDASAQPATTPAATPAPAVAPAPPHFALDGMNIYRRFSPDIRDKMVSFYDKILALKPLQPIQLNATTQMILFGIGKGQIKLAATIKEGRQYHLGALNEATGIRAFILYFPNEAELVGRFKAANYPAPAFKDMGGGRRGALVKDPGGFWLELIVAPGAAPTTYASAELGINVSNLEKSRAFYRSFVGLEELPPVRDALLGVTKYPFRHGQTVLNLWSVGKTLPADTGSAGIQYVIDNVDAVNARALEQKVTVEEPLGGLPNFSIRFVWLNDPDGVTNYFAQQGPRPAAAQ